MNFNICRKGFLTLEQLALCLEQLPNPYYFNQDDKHICYLPKRLNIDLDEDLLAPEEKIPYVFKLLALQDRTDGEGWSKVWRFEGQLIVVCEKDKIAFAQGIAAIDLDLYATK